MAFLLTTFHQTLNVPILKTKIALYNTMQEFSKQLFSNQISLINKDTYPRLKKELQNAQKDIFSDEGKIKSLFGTLASK